MPTHLHLDHQHQLQNAHDLLENTGLAIKLVNILGSPIETMIQKLPKRADSLILQTAQGALQVATNVALFTMKDQPGKKSSDRFHTLLTTTAGGAGGVFGLSALAVELPISTTIMLRSILDIARSEGESLKSVETQLACLEVFALGGKGKADDQAEYGYFAVRALLAHTVSQAAEYLVGKSTVSATAPGLVQLITTLAQRFSIQITEKVAAQAVPLVGAAGGAAINALFIAHFQDMARGHFTIRRLERLYGKELVQEEYFKLKSTKTISDEP